MQPDTPEPAPPNHKPLIIAILALSGIASAVVIFRFGRGIELPLRLLIIALDFLVLTLAGYVILRKN